MKKKKKKPSPQRSQQRTPPAVRLSQCMIVKNEEKNIERALDWAKNIAFEQIVVDTGSTDRTVELAEKMGAKVYHFEWIDDFAAAKNFAMDKAKGDWIAILDADEYMSHKDAKELMSILKKIQNDPVASRECDAVTCTFVDLDDNGNVISVISHQRIFQNRPDLRFVGRIHEVIKLKNNHFQAPNIRIIHTGYTRASYTDANKSTRNVDLLRSELERDPENPDIMLYLADSIKTTGTAEAIAEAETLFHKALQSDKPSNVFIKQLAYNHLIPRCIEDETKHDEAMRLCNEAVENLPDYIDYKYHRAVLNNKLGNYKEAEKDLKACENAFMNSTSIPTTQILMPSPLLLFNQLLISAQGLNDEEEIAKNNTIIHTMLSEGKDQTNIVGPYIRTLLKNGATDDEVLEKLSDIYDLNDPKDILFIARAAKDSGAAEFTRNIMKIAGEMLEQPTVRLSQCMIVKNEEKNIEKALDWAKDIAFEQIVVDTGSTDKTVELAEKMGARVCHFEWINDFAAAKNFAMDQAKGNWIAILDADEYMSNEDAKELITVLNKIQNDPELLKKNDSINCSWVQLDDDGKAYAVLTQQRVFQNRPDLRYVGKIHEAVSVKGYYNAENLRIMHTGYAQTAFNEAGKRERNIKLLREEHERDPENARTMLYLADSIKSDGTEESYSEAEQLYLKGLKCKIQAEPEIKRIAYDFLIPRFLRAEGKENEAEKMCNEAIADLPNHIDYYYYRALLNIKYGKFEKASDDLHKCEQAFMTSATIPETRVLLPSPILLFYQLLKVSKGLDDEHNIAMYSSVVNSMLSEGKNQPEVLGPYLAALFQEGLTGIEVFENLSHVYNVNNPNDLLCIAHAAKASGIVMFAEGIMEMLGIKPEEQ